jgi:hypothetical protein
MQVKSPAKLRGFLKLQTLAGADLGPAISQMMNPSIGKTRTSKHQRTFEPVELFDPMIDTKAQMFSARRIRPPIPVISIPMIFPSGCLRRR